MPTPARPGTLVLLALTVGCAAPDERRVGIAAPAEGSQFGYTRVWLDTAALGVDPADVVDVRVGPYRALLPEVEDGGLSVMVQGAPEPGPADVVLELTGEEVVAEDAYMFTPAADPVLARVVAFGASLTQGVQDGVPTLDSALDSPAAMLARATGAHLPLPLFVDPLFPTFEPADVGPPPACATPNVVAHVAQTAVEVMANLTDDEGVFSYAEGRLDPDLPIHNLAVGGYSLPDYAATTVPFDRGFLAHLVLDPHGGLTDPMPTSMLDRVEALEPTLIVCTDLYGNDIIGAIAASAEGELDLQRITPPETFQPALDEVLARLAATDAEVFLANLPRPTLLPATAEKRAQIVAEAVAAAEERGDDPDAAATEAAGEADALIAEIDAITEDYNARLADGAAAHPNVHVVDTWARVDEAAADGLAVGGDVLYPSKLRGLLSIDGVHFTDTGYAMTANAFLDAMDAALGTTLPRVDVEAVYADDPHRPSAMAAHGVDVTACD